MKTAKLFLLYFFTLVVVSACGGGSSPLTREAGADTDDGSGSTTAYSLTLSLVDANGAAVSQLRDGEPLTLNASVKDSNGAAKQGIVVSFVLSNAGLANFNNDTGTALSNDAGIASIILTAGDLSGSGTITASTTNSSDVSIGFESLGTNQQQPFSLELFGNAIQLASSGGDEIQLIAVVKNELNILLPDVQVTFSANENASLSNIDPVTNADGTARATLSTQNNKRNRQITVVASTATLQQLLTIDVVGTEVNINGASSIIINDTAPITIVLSDSDGNGIANQEVNLTASSGLLDVVNPITSENGQVTVNFTATEAGSVTINASALNASSNFIVSVQQDDFTFVNLPTESVALRTPTDIQLRWFKNNAAYANGSVTVTSSRGQLTANGVQGNSTVTTDAQGIATLSISSDFAGPASISAIGTDNTGAQVSARTEIEFIATTVSSIFADATPDLIGPEGQTSTITAILRDDAGNLVKGKIVNFSLEVDASGGSISPNNAITDSNGIASTVYTSNAVSGNNGVIILAQSDAVQARTELTVGDRAFDISLGTGSIVEIPDNSTYMKEFAVFVTDASGRPVSDVELTATVIPDAAQAYKKGTWIWDEINSFYTTINPDFTSRITVICPSEDVNGNGRLDGREDSNNNGVLDAGEDLNSNGTLDRGEDTNNDGFLTPGNVAAINFKDNISRTNEFGQATLQVRYPKEFGRWTDVNISVYGQSSGSESKQSQDFGLIVAAADLTEQANPPRNSPFGQSSSCADTL